MRVLSTLLLCLLIQCASAQRISPFEKFGKVTAEHLQKRIYSIDSNVSAVVLSDIGDAAIEGNSKGWFGISFTRHRIVHILGKAGYDEADVEIPLYEEGNTEERLESVKAVTYNLEGGKLVETRLEKNGIFEEKKDRHRIVRKFTFPAVREGCIIEYEYRISSDYIWNLDPWFFQGHTPVLWSEFKLRVPQFFTYTFLAHGYLPMYINEKKDSRDNFVISDSRGSGSMTRTSFTAGVTDYRWVMKDVPELKLESFSSAIKNHIASIEFQLASRNPPLEYHDYRSTWLVLTKELLQAENFGAALQKDNNWLGDQLKPVLKGTVSAVDKAKKIYNYVKEHFSCIDHNALYTTQSLKSVMKSKKGNVAEINILLTAMLRYAGLQAWPVLLSTTDHGYAIDTYPMITSFNYVVSKLIADEKEFYLDASYPRLGFGKLKPECFNGHARIVDEEATGVTLSADSVKEIKTTNVFITHDAKGNWMGKVTETPGYYESYDVRDRVQAGGKEAFFKGREKDFGMEMQITQSRIDSLKNYEEPVTLRYDIQLKPGKDDILYINPLFSEGYRTNPFKSSERYYPVEMPFASEQTYLLTMEVPAGYTVDEMPQQLIARMDEQSSGYFEYRISISGNIISLRMILKISRTLFLPEEYNILREFFNVVVKKQNEQIVFKKKK